MSAKLRLLVPEGTTNYIENPAARYDTSGISAVGATVTRSLDEARFGVASFKAVCPGSALLEGFYYRVSGLLNIQGAVSVSAYVRGEGSLRIRLIDNPNGMQWYSQNVRLVSTRWTRIEVSGRCTGSDDMRLYLETSADLPQEVTFYADGLQMELQEESTSYCDGDQAGCRWNLMAHNSVSIRSAYTRMGGRWIDLAGPSCEAQNLYMTVAGGFGVAPLANYRQPYADSPGSYYQNTKVFERMITLSFHAKTTYRYRTNKLPSLKKLHTLRQQLIDVIKPDRTAGGEAFLLEYQDGEVPLYLWARYDGGLEGEWDVRNQFVNSFPLRMIAVSPFFAEDDQEVSALNFRNTQDINYAVQRVDGTWAEMNGGFDAQVRAMMIGTRGEVIAVGDFIHANNNSGAINPQIFANHIAYWDGEKWNAYGSGANDIIRALAVAPNGVIFVGGDFTQIGGVAADYIAYWDGSSWNALSGGSLNGAVRAIDIDPNGNVFVGGDFTLFGANALNYVGMWNGSWIALGSNNGLNGPVYSISITDDGSVVYMGGNFTDEYSDPGILNLNYIASYEPAFVTFYELGTGFDDVVRKVLVIPSGRLYAGGDFTQSGDLELVLLYAAYWNGASWFEIGVGLNEIVRDLDVSFKDTVVFGGDFSRAGSADAFYAALWNGSGYVNLDISLSNEVYAVQIDSRDNIFLGPNGTAAEFSAITTVENIGSAECNPILYVSGPGNLLWVENQTTQKRLYLDLVIAESEEISIDFAQGKITSSVRGNLAYTINPGSDMRAWTLIPGNNKIALLMTEDVDAEAHLYYVPRHWSVDATALTEAF